MLRDDQSIGDFWRCQFDEGEPEFTKWLLGDEKRSPIGHPAEVRYGIEMVTGTYLWDLDSEVRNREGEFRIDGTAECFHHGEYSKAVIEAQFNQNRGALADHLGRLLVYAQLASADVVIWICPRRLGRRDRSVFSRTVSYIDNRSDIDFYQVYIDVSRTQDGRIEAIVKNVHESPSPVSDVESKFLDSQQTKFWTMLEKKIDTDPISSAEPAPEPVYRCGRAVSATGVNPEFRIDSVSNEVKFRVKFETDLAEERYRSLKYGPTSFDELIPRYQHINWLDGKQRRTPVLEITRSEFSIFNQIPWDGFADWLLNTLRTFNDVIEAK